MSDTSIMTSKCLYIFHWLYIRCLYHSGSAMVRIPHERVRLPPENAENPALKPRNRGTLVCKKRWAPVQLWLPSVCIHFIGYTQGVCIIQEVPWYRYPTNESVYRPRTPKILPKPINGGTLGCKKGWATLQLWLPSVFAHWKGHMKGVHHSSMSYNVFKALIRVKYPSPIGIPP